MKPSFKIETVTPAQARRWREAGEEHFYNRSINEDRVLALFAEMDNGHWNTLASRIDIATDPETRTMFLTGGYHTCHAIEMYNRPVRCVVYRDSNPLLTNQSKAFTPGQALSIALSQERGQKIGPSIAKVIDTASRVLFDRDGLNYKRMTTATHARTIIDKYPALVDLGVAHSRALSAAQKYTDVPASVFLLWLEKHPELSESFRTHVLATLAELPVPPSAEAELREFVAARPVLAEMGERMKKDGRNSKEGRELPRKKMLAALDFALERNGAGSTISARRGFKQELTAHLKKLKLV
jgi:hypothetical protein